MFKIAVLISGGGSNLQSLIDAIERGDLPAEIGMIIADRPAEGLKRAQNHGIAGVMLNRKEYGANLSQAILETIPEDTDLIVLAGYLSILSNQFIQQWEKKIINIHPSLLPDFGGKGMYGMKVHEAVLATGRTFSGCTVHFVDSGIDTGNIIMQKRVSVYPDDTPQTLQKRVLDQEHMLLVESIRNLIGNKQQS